LAGLENDIDEEDSRLLLEGGEAVSVDLDDAFAGGEQHALSEDELKIMKAKGLNARGGDHGFGEIMIHQLIETIEFSLNTVSNTASYLRLWALSLAHSQLAKVFYAMTLGAGLKQGSVLAVIIGLVFFCAFTFGIMFCMDIMECFLHVLRLHWVEFNSKFFKGQGYEFKPLDYEKKLK